jgi:hypothetical protein
VEPLITTVVEIVSFFIVKSYTSKGKVKKLFGILFLIFIPIFALINILYVLEYINNLLG